MAAETAGAQVKCMIMDHAQIQEIHQTVRPGHSDHQKRIQHIIKEQDIRHSEPI